MSEPRVATPIADATSFTLGRLPRLTFGAGSIAAVPGIVAGHGRRALLVTGAGIVRRVRAAWRRWSRVSQQRAWTLVARVAVAVRAGSRMTSMERSAPGAGSAVEVVLGVGGGSAHRLGQGDRGAAAHAGPGPDAPGGIRGPTAVPWARRFPWSPCPRPRGPGRRRRATPSSACAAPDGFKRSFRDERLVPADAMVDPDLLDGLSPLLIAFNGLDALTQLLESYVSQRARARHGRARARRAGRHPRRPPGVAP